MTQTSDLVDRALSDVVLVQPLWPGQRPQAVTLHGVGYHLAIAGFKIVQRQTGARE